MYKKKKGFKWVSVFPTFGSGNWRLKSQDISKILEESERGEEEE